MVRKICLLAIACAALLVSQGAMAADDELEAKAAGAGSKFYQKVALASCSGGTCTATFTKVSSGKVLQTTNLSCSATASGNIPAFATLQAGGTILTYVPLNPFQSGGVTFATGASAGAVFIDKGKTPSVVISGGATSATCTLSGRLAKG